MADPSSSFKTLLTSLYYDALTNTTSPIFNATTASPSHHTRVTTYLTSFSSLILPSSKSTSPWTTFLVTQTATLISSTIPNTTSDEGTSNKSNASSGLSEEERRRYLNILQENTTRQLLPAVLFMAIVAVVGFLGNSLVLLVYSKKSHRKAVDIFIMAIAAFDLFANVLAIPVEIYTTFHFWDFDSLALCKLRVYFSTFTCFTSAMILLAVAFSRYRKICRPFGNQTSLRATKITTAVIALVSALICAPQLILYGIRRRPTPIPGVYGQLCSFDSKYVFTIWPMVYYIGVVLLFLIVCVPLVVFYVLIGIKAWRHSKFHGISIIQNTPTTSEQTTSETLTSVDDIEKTSKACIFSKKKKNCDIKPGDSSNDEGNGNEEKERNKEENTSINGEDIRNVRRIHSPTKDRSQLRIPALQDSTDKNKDTHEGDGKLKSEVSSEMLPLLECHPHREKSKESKEATESCQNDNSTIKQSGYAENLQWDDITSCLKDEAKTEEQRDVTTHGSSRKNNLQSATAEKAKKENIALNKMETPPNSAASDAADGSCGYNNSTCDGTVGETNRDITQDYGSSPRNGPRNGTSKSKLHKNKSSPNRRVLTKTTLMLINITAVFIIAFLPHLVLVACMFAVPNFFENISDAGYTAYNLFLRFYFINSAANAIIYSICDVRFRDKVQTIMKCEKNGLVCRF